MKRENRTWKMNFSKKVFFLMEFSIKIYIFASFGISGSESNWLVVANTMGAKKYIILLAQVYYITLPSILYYFDK